MRWLLLILIPMGVGAVVAMTSPEQLPWLANWMPTSASSEQPEQTPVTPEKRTTIFASGIVEGAQRDVPMRFEIAGRLQKINVTEGQRVKQGELLAQLETATLEKQLKLAESKLALAKSERTRLTNGERDETVEVARNELLRVRVEVEQAKQRYDRAIELQKRNAITSEEMDDRKSQYKSALAAQKLESSRIAEIEAPVREDDLAIADAKVAQAEAEVALAKTELEKSKLVAPTDGLILRVAREPGQLLGPQDIQPLLVMVNTEKMRARAYVEELDALAVKPGQTAYVTADGDPGRKFPGHVVSCSPYMVPKKYLSNEPGERIDVKVREVIVELEEQETLVVGLPVDVMIETEFTETLKDSEEPPANPDLVSTESQAVK